MVCPVRCIVASVQCVFTVSFAVKRFAQGLSYIHKLITEEVKSTKRGVCE